MTDIDLSFLTESSAELQPYTSAAMQAASARVSVVISAEPRSAAAAVERLRQFAEPARCACAGALAEGARASLLHLRDQSGRAEEIVAAVEEWNPCLWCRLYTGRLRAHFCHVLDPERALEIADAVRGQAVDLQQEYVHFVPQLTCTLGAMDIVSGLTELNREVYPSAVDFFTRALARTARPKMPRSITCLTLPTETRRLAFHDNAFNNLALALARSGDPEAQELAEEQLPAVRNSYGDKDYVLRAKVWRLIGVLKAARHERTDTRLHARRRSLRLSAENALMRAFEGLLKHGTAVEAVDCALEFASLPWVKDPAADVRDSIAFSTKLRACLAELPPSLHKMVVDFAAHAGTAVADSVLQGVREAVREAGGMPLIAKWRSRAQ
jgi:hypothetical protein